MFLYILHIHREEAALSLGFPSGFLDLSCMASRVFSLVRKSHRWRVRKGPGAKAREWKMKRREQNEEKEKGSKWKHEQKEKEKKNKDKRKKRTKGKCQEKNGQGTTKRNPRLAKQEQVGRQGQEIKYLEHGLEKKENFWKTTWCQLSAKLHAKYTSHKSVEFLILSFIPFPLHSIVLPDWRFRAAAASRLRAAESKHCSWLYNQRNQLVSVAKMGTSCRFQTIARWNI